MKQLPLWDFCYKFRCADNVVRYGVIVLPSKNADACNKEGLKRLRDRNSFVYDNLIDTKVLPHREHCSHVPPLEGF